MMEVPEGFYKEELNKTEWIVPNYYNELSAVGTGAYGQVCSAVNTITGEQLAIKKLSRPFQTAIHAKRTFREIKLLRHMNHENVIDLIDVFTTASSLQDFDDVYLVTALMGADLNSIVKVQKLSDDHVQFLIYQILRGLKDLKPSNVAVNEDCELKILDFGLARMVDDSMTGYVATRWYRAPEIMLNWMHYNNTVDVWSVGCIMAELLTSKVLFRGDDHIDQIKKIICLVGTPSNEYLQKISSGSARSYIAQLPVYARMEFRDVFAGANPHAVDLLEKMLSLDPDFRITAEQALQHEYLSKYHDPEDEPLGEPFDLSYDGLNLDIPQWRENVYNEIMDFKRHQQQNMGSSTAMEE